MGMVELDRKQRKSKREQNHKDRLSGLTRVAIGNKMLIEVPWRWSQKGARSMWTGALVLGPIRDAICFVASPGRRWHLLFLYSILLSFYFGNYRLFNCGILRN